MALAVRHSGAWGAVVEHDMCMNDTSHLQKTGGSVWLPPVVGYADNGALLFFVAAPRLPDIAELGTGIAGTAVGCCAAILNRCVAAKDFKSAEWLCIYGWGVVEQVALHINLTNFH